MDLNANIAILTSADRDAGFRYDLPRMRVEIFPYIIIEKKKLLKIHHWIMSFLFIEDIKTVLLVLLTDFKKSY